MLIIWKFPKTSRAAQNALSGHTRPACLKPWINWMPIQAYIFGQVFRNAPRGKASFYASWVRYSYEVGWSGVQCSGCVTRDATIDVITSDLMF